MASRLAVFTLPAEHFGPNYTARMELSGEELLRARGVEDAMPGLVDAYMVWIGLEEPSPGFERGTPVAIMQMIFEFEDPDSIGEMMPQMEAMTEQDLAAMGKQYVEGWLEVAGEVEVSIFDPGPIGDASYGWSYVLHGIKASQGELPPDVTALHEHIVVFTRGKFMGEAVVFYFAPQPPDLAVETAGEIHRRIQAGGTAAMEPTPWAAPGSLASSFQSLVVSAAELGLDYSADLSPALDT